MTATLTTPATAPTVTVLSAGQAGPFGPEVLLTRHGGDPGHAIESRQVRRWTHWAQVGRYRAAMALTLAEQVRPGMTVPEIGAAILAALDREPEGWTLAGAAVAEAAQRRAAAGVRATRAQLRTYRRYWPCPARTALCLRLADRLMAGAGAR